MLQTSPLWDQWKSSYAYCWFCHSVLNPFSAHIFLFSVFIHTHEMLVTETLEIWIHPLKVLAAPTCLKACPEPSHLSNNSSPRPSWLHFYVDSICGDCVECAAKAALALKCSASSLAAPVSLRQSSNAETDTALGGACSHLGMCHPKTGFTEWVMHGPEQDPGHPGPLWAYCHRKLANRTNCWGRGKELWPLLISKRAKYAC